MKIEKNLGTADRIVRFVLFAVVILLFALDVIDGLTAILLLSLATIMLVTTVFSFCPLYRVFRLRSTSK